MKTFEKIKTIIVLALVSAICLTVGACSIASSYSPAKFEFTSSVPGQVTYGDEIYFRDYISFEYYADYELYATYYDYEKDKQVTDEKQDNMSFRFEKVTDYDFTIQRTFNGKIETLTCKIACFPEKAKLATPVEYNVNVSDELYYFEDLLYYCQMDTTNEEHAQSDIGFSWVFDKVVIKAVSVEGTDKEINLEGQESIFFDTEAIYEFHVKAVNKAGEVSTILTVNTCDTSMHNNDVTAYVLDNKIEFTMPDRYPEPNDGATVKTRLGTEKFDAVYDADTKIYTISNFDKTIDMNVEQRLYVTGSNGNYSTVLVKPEHILTNENILDFQNATDGYAILSEDIDMTGITTYGNQRTGSYKDNYFKGYFDGRGHTISNFATGTTGYAGGFFWSLDNAVIKNVIFDKATVSAKKNSVLAGRTTNGTKIENVAIKVAQMTTTETGAFVGPTESGMNFKNVLLYVCNTADDKYIEGMSSFFGGFYMSGFSIENAWLVSNIVDLPMTPNHTSIVTSIDGLATINRYSEDEARAELDTSNMPTDLLKQAVLDWFVNYYTPLYSSNIADLQTATSEQFRLMENIDFATAFTDTWTPAGTFSGIIEGNNYTISNFKGKSLFNYVNGAKIKDVKFTNVTEITQGFISQRVTGGITLENVLIDIQGFKSTQTWRSALGYQVTTKAVTTLKDVFISMPVVTKNAEYLGLTSTNAADDLWMQNVYMYGGSGNLFSTSSSNNATYVPSYWDINGQKTAQNGKDYFISMNGWDFYFDDMYNNIKPDFKAYFETLYPKSGIVELTQDNIATELGKATGGYYVLKGDVDMSKVSWISYPSDAAASAITFSGTLNGNGNVLKNFTTVGDKTNARVNGLFNWLQGATIKNIIFENPTIKGANGLIAGRSNGGNKFENIVIYNAAFDDAANNSATVAVGNSSSSYDVYKDVIVYVASATKTPASSSGFLAAVYSYGVKVDNVNLITETGLQVAPTSHAAIATKIQKTDGTDAVLGTDYNTYATLKDMQNAETFKSASETVKANFEKYLKSLIPTA